MGEIRNPEGRPKGSYSLSTVIRKWLDMEHGDLKLPDGRVIRISKQDEAIRAQIKKAIEEHDTYALKTVLEFAYGKAVQFVENKEVKEFSTEIEEKEANTKYLIELLKTTDGMIEKAEEIISETANANR